MPVILPTRHAPETQIENLLRPYQLRTVRIGVATTVMVLVMMVVYPLLGGAVVTDVHVYLALLVIGSAAITVVALVPWSTLFARGVGQLVLYAWSAVDIVLVAAVVTVTGCLTSEAFFLYAPIMVFFTASYPVRGQILLFMLSILLYGFAVGHGGGLQLAPLFFRLGTMSALLYLASFLARELARQMRDHHRSRIEAEERALHDPLTGLPNRPSVRALLAEILDRRGSGNVAAFYIDLDDFKGLNDLFGHPMGDEFLQVIARRLRFALPTETVVGRVGGDEFVVIFPHLDEVEDAQVAAARLDATLQQPVTVDDVRLPSSASIGVVIAIPGQGADEVLRAADIAMYHAKAEGKRRVAFFDGSMEAAVRSRYEIERELRVALEHGDHETSAFEVYFQPQLSLRTGAVTGVEALVRWHHPTRGLIGPSLFVPVAEATGLIVALGRAVLRQSCRELAAWRFVHEDLSKLVMSVNVSPQQLVDGTFPIEVAALLQEYALPPAALKLEITEAALALRPEVVIESLEHLHALGVGIAIDDFGTGYSSLSYLHRFPVDTLKVDQSFVRRLGTDERASSLVIAIVELSRRLGLTVIAEGIEHPHQAVELERMGCQVGQGFLFLEPVPAPAVLPFLTGHAALDAA